MSLPDSHSQARPLFPLLFVLAALCFGLRAMGLHELAIFGDEAIYLRWAQVIRGDGLGEGHPWVSLVDPKPPLHFWLVAWVWNWFADPLRSARMLSVLCAVAAVPLTMGVGVELGRVRGAREVVRQVSGRTWGLLAVLLSLFCPFLAFYQRLATADALFVTESLAAVWLSLRWGRQVTGERPTSAWPSAVGLGVALGAGLMTRQGMSYTLCAMPVVAWLVHAVPGRRRVGQGILQLFAVSMIAWLCWLPFLAAHLEDAALARARHRDGPQAVATGADYMAEVRLRVFFQDSIAGGGISRGDTIVRNARVAFLPGWDENGAVNAGWFYVYLTPAVYAAAILGAIMLGVRQRRAGVVVGVWFALMALPVILLGQNIMSRHMVAAVPPFIFAAAFWLAEASAWLMRARVPAALAWGTLILLWAVTMTQGMREIAIQAVRPREQLLTEWWRDSGGAIRGDRYQYLTGWTAGYATRKAIRFLDDQAMMGRVVVITEETWGNAADAVWTYLSPRRNVQLYYSASRVPQVAAGGRGFILGRKKHLYLPAEAVELPRDAAIFYVVNEAAPGEAIRDLAAMSANLGRFWTFYGLEGAGGEGVVIFEVKVPASPVPPR